MKKVYRIYTCVLTLMLLTALLSFSVFAADDSDVCYTASR